MHYSVIEACYLGGYSVWLRFRDGAAGTLNLEAELRGEVFEPLLDERNFAAFRVEGGALEWPNGASLAPEFLHSRVLAGV